MAKYLLIESRDPYESSAADLPNGVSFNTASTRDSSFRL